MVLELVHGTGASSWSTAAREHEEQCCSAVLRGYVTVPGSSDVHVSVTLCRFDDKVASRSKSGPIIPCERRLAYLEILEIQGHGFLRAF